MKIYNTNYDLFVKNITSSLSQVLIGPWKKRSLGILSLLLGYYFSSTITSYYLEVYKQRVLIALVTTLFVEIIIRFRGLFLNGKGKILFLIIDNFRIGVTYSIVLEAFKLGS